MPIILRIVHGIRDVLYEHHPHKSCNSLHFSLYSRAWCLCMYVRLRKSSLYVRSIPTFPHNFSSQRARTYTNQWYSKTNKRWTKPSSYARTYSGACAFGAQQRKTVQFTRNTWRRIYIPIRTLVILAGRALTTYVPIFYESYKSEQRSENLIPRIQAFIHKRCCSNTCMPY